MEEEHSRTETGVFCLQCAGDIFECRAGGDHWYECACGCACVDCRVPMKYEDKDTSSGIEYREYRCGTCRRAGIVRKGMALWKAMEEAHRRWLAYDDVDGRKLVELTHSGEWVI